MRVIPSIDVSGQFWLPKRPDRKVAGTLHIEDGGKVYLEIVDNFDDISVVLTGREDLSRIVGRVEQYGYVTLENCLYESRNISFGGGPSRSRLYAHVVYLGVEFEQGETPLFSSFTFRLEGLAEWHSITGINVHYDGELRSGTVRYVPVADVQLWEDGGATLKLKFTWTGPSPGVLTDATITQDSYLELRWPEARSLREFAQFAHQLLQFMALAMGATVSLSKVNGRSPALIEKHGRNAGREVPIEIVFSPLMHADKVPKIEGGRMLFRYADVKGRMESMFGAWRRLATLAGTPLNVYFSALTDPHRYVNVRFLFLVQALEALHRRTSAETAMSDDEFQLMKDEIHSAVSPRAWDFLSGRLAYANELGLSKRLHRLMEPVKEHFGDHTQRKDFVQAVVESRNYFTHFPKALEDRIGDGAQLWDLCGKLEALMQLHLLVVLGFSSLEISAFVARSSHLTDKLARRPRGHWPTSAENIAAPN